MEQQQITTPSLYGLLAEFDKPDQIVAAARRTYDEGYRRIDAYSPYPIEELSEAIGFHRTILPLIVLACGILGGIGGFMMQYYLAAVDYPINVGGRPLLSTPAFIPITFETTVLVAAFGAVIGMIVLNNLPQPYHPVFNVPNFAFASRDRFFLLVEANDQRFDYAATKRFLESLNPLEVSDVEP